MQCISCSKIGSNSLYLKYDVVMWSADVNSCLIWLNMLVIITNVLCFFVEGRNWFTEVIAIHCAVPYPNCD